MAVVRVFVLLILITYSTPIFGFVPIKVKLKRGAEALLVLPNHYDSFYHYPVCIVLHGNGETAQEILLKWKAIVKKEKMIFLAPIGRDIESGFLRTPIDERDDIVDLIIYLKKHYRINPTKTIVAGFSKGGSFAIELGVMHPTLFPNVLCIFGFYDTESERFDQKVLAPLQRYAKYGDYRRSKFYFLTGETDVTRPSLSEGERVLTSYHVNVKLNPCPNLNHQYPPKWEKEFHNIRDWFDRKED